jgi:hypothetical protein
MSYATSSLKRATPRALLRSRRRTVQYDVVTSDRPFLVRRSAVLVFPRPPSAARSIQHVTSCMCSDERFSVQRAEARARKPLGSQGPAPLATSPPPPANSACRRRYGFGGATQGTDRSKGRGARGPVDCQPETAQLHAPLRRGETKTCSKSSKYVLQHSAALRTSQPRQGASLL